MIAEGSRRFLIGLGKKVLIANILGEFCDTFKASGDWSVAFFWLYGIAFSLHIYFDFSGYSDMAIGLGKILGFNFLENFNYPFISKSITEFWRRWHISLSQWLRDYVYISLGGNRKGQVRKYVNLMITFLVSGIWHGSNWQFVVWGALHGIYQICGALTKKLRDTIKSKLGIKTDCFSYRLFQGLITFALVDFAWLFFRSSSLSEAFQILQRIATELHPFSTIVNCEYLLGMEQNRFSLLVVEVLIMLIIDVIHAKKISIVAWLDKQNTVFRWIVYVSVTMVIITGMLYNYGADSSTFIYAQF